MRSLPIFVRLQDRPVILLGDGDAAEAKRLLLERAGARIVGEDGPAALAIVAIEDDAEALAATDRLKARGILVNATDRPEQCDFTLPAIIDRDPVLLAIGTDGRSAGLAKALRQRLEQILPASLGILAEALHDARQRMRDRWPDARERRRAIDAALASGGPLDPLADQRPGALDGWLGAGSVVGADGVRIIKLASTDPDQLTLAQARLLGQADHIVHGPDVPASIVARGRSDARRWKQASLPDPLPDGLVVQLSMG